MQIRKYQYCLTISATRVNFFCFVHDCIIRVQNGMLALEVLTYRMTKSTLF